jgi:hypothetical protein
MKMIGLTDYYNQQTIYISVNSIVLLKEETIRTGEIISVISLVNGSNWRVLENNIGIIWKMGQ